MKRYYLLYLVWILPAYMLFITIQQGMVYKGTIDTYENGNSYVADVTDFDVKQIASQSNGYVEIRFETPEKVVEQRLTLSIQMAQQILESPVIPVRYQENSFQEIVMVTTYSLQKSTSLFNLFIAFIGFAVTTVVALLIHRFAGRKLKNQDPDYIIERIDQ